MERSKIEKMISDSIQEVTHEYIKDLKTKNGSQQTTNYLNSTEISEDDIDATLFFGGHPKKNEKKTGPITIKEATNNNLKITVGEIKEFENSFQKIMENIPGASIVFDKQSNGYSILAVKRADGVEAKASGIINLGDNGKLTWSYSLLNGLILNAQNLKLSEGNKLMFEALYNHYNDWQKKWREMLNLPQAPEEEAAPAGNMSEPAPGANAGANLAPPVSGGAAPNAPGGGTPPAPAV